MPGCGRPADGAALPDAAEEPGLHGSDAGETTSGPRRTAEGACYCGQGKPSEAAVVEAAGVARQCESTSVFRVIAARLLTNYARVWRNYRGVDRRTISIST